MAPTDRKVVVVGDSGCGKTCLLVVSSRDEMPFPRDYVPTIFSTYAKTLIVNKRSIRLSLWDTAGQPEYDRLRPLAYPETDVFLLCFALNSRDSFSSVQEKWIPEIKHVCRKAPVVLIGTKKDLRRDKEGNSVDTQRAESVSTEEAKSFAQASEMFDYIECSAKTNAGVREVFEATVRAVQYSRKIRKRGKKHKPMKCAVL